MGLSLSPPFSHSQFTRGILLNWTVTGLNILPNVVYYFLFLVHRRAFIHVTQPCFRPKISTLCLMRFERCKFWPSVTSLKVSFTPKNSIEFNIASVKASSPYYFTFSFARLHESSNVPQSRFPPWNLKVFLTRFLMMPVSALL